MNKPFINLNKWNSSPNKDSKLPMSNVENFTLLLKLKMEIYGVGDSVDNMEILSVIGYSQELGH